MPARAYMLSKPAPKLTYLTDPSVLLNGTFQPAVNEVWRLATLTGSSRSVAGIAPPSSWDAAKPLKTNGIFLKNGISVSGETIQAAKVNAQASSVKSQTIPTNTTISPAQGELWQVHALWNNVTLVKGALATGTINHMCFFYLNSNVGIKGPVSGSGFVSAIDVNAEQVFKKLEGPIGEHNVLDVLCDMVSLPTGGSFTHTPAAGQLWCLCACIVGGTTANAQVQLTDGTTSYNVILASTSGPQPILSVAYQNNPYLKIAQNNGTPTVFYSSVRVL